ncbi:MAG: MFS transporter [Acidobacteria bacterium]|nr:MFS transporter [Acidobacteriota bacterium]
MTPEQRNKPALFYGWFVVGVSVLIVIITNGLTIGGIPVFYKSLIDEFQWNRTIIATAGAVTLLGAGLLVPVVGIYLDHFGAKPFMIAGTLVLGAAMLLYSRVSSPLQMYGAHFLFACSLALAGVVTNILLVSNWFVRRRGTAVGAVITGTSFGGVLLPPAATWLIGQFGWRMSMVILSSLVWFLLLPLVVFLVKNHPRDQGLHPDGEAVDAGDVSTRAAGPPPGLTAGQALSTGTFWSLLLGSALSFYVIFSISQQFILHLQSPQVGLTKSQAALAQSALFLCSVGGKFFFGYLSDRWAKKHVNLLCCTVMFMGSLFLLNLNTITAYPFCVLFGLGFGGTYVTIQLMVAECFGIRALGRILGIVTLAETIGAAAGNILTGSLFDRTGSYELSFRLIVACALAALVMMAMLKPRVQVIAPERPVEA